MLETQLQRRGWPLPGVLSDADFLMAVFLPFNDGAGLPLEQYLAVAG